MLTLPIQANRVSGPALILSLAVLLYFFNSSIQDLLVFKPQSIEQFEFWRLISANFLHTNHAHLLLNSAGLVLLWVLHGDAYRTSTYLTVFLICSLGTTLGLYVLFPDLKWYVGLSGTLHGVFIWGAYLDIKRGFRTGWLLLIGGWIKVAYEFYFGPSDELSGLIEANVAIESHLTGLVTGTLIVIYFYVRGTKKPG